MRLHRVLGAVGRTLIAAGVLILLFVAYQLWGTGLQEARAQRDLKSDFLESLQTTTTTTTAPDDPVVADSTTTSTPAPPPVPEGEAVAIIKIPNIGIEKAVVEGVGVRDLKKGPGHYPDTPLPGQPGNAAIAGHRTTYGAPFHDLDELEPGDEILVTTRQGEFSYIVDRSLIVAPDQVEVLDPTDDSRLTLTTCHPRYSARQRLIVVAILDGRPAPAPPTTVPTADEREGTDGDDAAGEDGDDDGDPAVAGDDEPPAAFEDPAGLSGDPAARWPTALWGAVTALVALAFWLLGRWWRRWPSYLLGTPVFLVALFLFFENMARLFPANI